MSRVSQQTITMSEISRSEYGDINEECISCMESMPIDHYFIKCAQGHSMCGECS